MKISQETIDNLKYFQRIGQSMKFKEGADYITIIGGECAWPSPDGDPRITVS